MDIEILLALQQFREGTGGFLADFLSKMTFLGELYTAPVIMAVVYWCVSKDFGTYLLLGWSGNRIVNGALKVTACAYRPWIRDARIVPYGNSINTATGYSFPSGHSMNAATVFGGGVVRRELPRAACHAGAHRGARRIQPNLSRRPHAAGRSGRHGCGACRHVGDGTANALVGGAPREGCPRGGHWIGDRRPCCAVCRVQILP